MAEFQRRIVPPHLRSLRNKDTKTTIKSKLGEEDPKELRSTDVQEKGRKTPTVESFKHQETAWPSKGPAFADKPEAKSGIKKGPKARKITSAANQPISKRRITGRNVGVPKKKAPDKFAAKTTTQQWGSDFSKWLRSAKADVEIGVSKATKEVGEWSGALPSSFSVNELWDKFAKQFDGEVPKNPPASAKKKLNKAVTNARKRVTTSGEPTTKPKVKKKPIAISKFVREEAPGEGDTEVPTIKAPKEPFKVKPKKVAKKVVKKKDISEAEANRRIAAREKEIGGHTVSTKRGPEHGGIKKAAATPSKDGRSAKQIKAEEMHEGMSYSPKEETADFKDFRSKRGRVKGFQFNLVGKNKTKEAGMKRAREAYAEEQRDRKKISRQDHYQYGEGRRAVKKKGGAMRKSQGGTIRLKTGGAVIDTYDYN